MVNEGKGGATDWTDNSARADDAGESAHCRCGQGDDGGMFWCRCERWTRDASETIVARLRREPAFAEAVTGEKMAFEAALPEDMGTLVEALEGCKGRFAPQSLSSTQSRRPKGSAP